MFSHITNFHVDYHESSRRERVNEARVERLFVQQVIQQVRRRAEIETQKRRKSINHKKFKVNEIYGAWNE